MITVIFLAVIALVVVGGIFIAIQAQGQKGKAGAAVAMKQQQMTKAPGDVRTSGSAND